VYDGLRDIAGTAGGEGDGDEVKGGDVSAGDVALGLRGHGRTLTEETSMVNEAGEGVHVLPPVACVERDSGDGESTEVADRGAASRPVVLPDVVSDGGDDGGGDGRVCLKGGLLKLGNDFRERNKRHYGDLHLEDGESGTKVSREDEERGEMVVMKV
jgi:hypothetical protein